MESHLLSVPEKRCKVIVAHHPLSPGVNEIREPAAGGAQRALQLFADWGVEIILTGHRHHTHVENSREVYPGMNGRGIWLVQAGTAMSMRGRGPEKLKNSFNLLDIHPDKIAVISYVFSDQDIDFVPAHSHELLRDSKSQITTSK